MITKLYKQQETVIIMKEFKYSVMVLLLKEIDATWIEGIMTEIQCFYYSITCPNTRPMCTQTYFRRPIL